MADEAKIHVGDVGTELVVVCKDEEGEVIDVSAATEMEIYLTSPAGTTTEHTAVLDGDGTDGKIKYVTVAGDLSIDGGWTIQGWADLGADEFSSPEYPFEVFASRRYPDGDDR